MADVGQAAEPCGGCGASQRGGRPGRHRYHRHRGCTTGSLSAATSGCGSCYLPPWDTFARHDPDRFVGRDWLTAQVDAFLTRERCGYFVLEADAGLGKSAFLAELVRRRGYLHHFVRPGAASRVDAALKSLAAQLVRVTDSDPYLLADLDASALFEKVAR